MKMIQLSYCALPLLLWVTTVSAGERALPWADLPPSAPVSVTPPVTTQTVSASDKSVSQPTKETKGNLHRWSPGEPATDSAATTSSTKTTASTSEYSL